MEVVMKVSSSNSTYQTASCATFYKNGSITFEDGNANKLVYTYTNCVEAVTFNGTTI